MGPDLERKGNEMNINEILSQHGLTSEEIAATDAANPSNWDRELVEKLVSDYEDPKVAARRAKRSGPGLERARKLYEARKSFLAQN